MANDLEVTLEANPTSIEAGRFAGYRDAGVNRVSVGVQALNDLDLKALGRLHSAQEALAAIDVARATFDRVSFDLIYARQDQTSDAWRSELKQALALDPDHLSLYQLTIEDGTAFGDRFKRGLLRGLPGEDLSADLWEITQELCLDAGLPAYEVSNHAKTGQESRHNLMYWRSGNWAGIGPGAHGRLTLYGTRYESIAAKLPTAWLKRVQAGRGGDVIWAPLSAEGTIEERLLMGLRMVEGIEMPLAWLKVKNNIINDLSDEGHLLAMSRTLKVTEQGRPLLNAVIRRLLTD